MAITGIDVSRHQGSVDFAAVKRAGHRFAIIKATEGTSYSYVSWYRVHAPKVEAAGLVLGAYHFLRADRDPAGQARYFVQTVGSFRGRVAVVDVETAANDTEPMIGHVRAFAAEFRRLVPGHPLVVYTGRWYWVGVMGDPQDGPSIGPLWHSEYEGTQAEVDDGPEGDDYGGWPGATVWQWTSSGTCPGVAGRCDMNMLLRGSLADLTDTEDDDVVTPEDRALIADRVWKEPVAATDGKTMGPAEAHLRWANHNAGVAVALLRDLVKKVDPDAIVDEGLIVQGVLAGLEPEAIAAAVVAAIPADQAKRVADELAARLAA